MTQVNCPSCTKPLKKNDIVKVKLHFSNDESVIVKMCTVCKIAYFGIYQDVNISDNNVITPYIK